MTEPIQNILDTVFSEMCHDCLNQEFRCKDELFLSMFAIYINALRIQYGEHFAIPSSVAKIVLETKIYINNLFYKQNLGEDLIKVDKMSTKEINKTNFYLTF